MAPPMRMVMDMCAHMVAETQPHRKLIAHLAQKSLTWLANVRIPGRVRTPRQLSRSRPNPP
jgi:hypothetical protein